MAKASEVVFNQFLNDPFYVGNPMKSRVFVHDLIHLMTGHASRSAKGEEATAVIQAIITRDPRMTLKPDDYVVNGTTPTIPHFSDITTNVIPHVRRLIQRHLPQRTKPAPQLTGQELTEVYKAGLRIDMSLRHHLKRPFHQIEVPELMETDFSKLQTAIRSIGFCNRSCPVYSR